MNIPDKIGGISRIIRAGKFSWQGFTHGLKDEPAFRQEFIVSAVTLPLLFFIKVPLYAKVLVLISHLLVMITELLNSAIEKVVDIASPDYHDFAKAAKDMGSLAVFFSIVICGICWTCLLFI